MEKNEQYFKLKAYVNAAADLAEQVQADIKKGKRISSDTVVKLSKFISASAAFEKGLEVINAINHEIN